MIDSKKQKDYEIDTYFSSSRLFDSRHENPFNLEVKDCFSSFNEQCRNVAR